MAFLKNKKVRELAEKLPSPKFFTILAVALILGVIIYLIILSLNLK